MFKKRLLVTLIASILAPIAPNAFAVDAAGIQAGFQLQAQSRSNAQQAASILASESVDDALDGFPLPPAILTGGGPTGGGLIPITSTAPKTDGTRIKIGYCSWDNGSVTSASGRAAGSNSLSAPALAVIAAGADGIFSTTCAQIQAGTSAQGDDIVISYSTSQLRSLYSLYVGAPVANLSALNTIAATALREGEVRLVKSDNTIQRWNSTTNTWALVGTDLTKIASGLVTAPSIAFSAQPGTGLYYTGTGTGFAVNGVNVGAFDAAGLSTTSLAMTGNAQVGGNLTVTGTSTLTGLLTANGGISTNNITTTNLTATGLLTVNDFATNTLTTTGAAVIGGNLNVSGITVTQGVVTPWLSTTGNAAIGGTLTTTGLLMAPGGISTNAISASSIDATGDLSVGGRLTVASTTALAGKLTANGGLASTTGAFSGLLSANGGLAATDITATGTLAVTGATTLTGVLAANGGVTTTNLTATGLTSTGQLKLVGVAADPVAAAAAGTFIYRNDTAKLRYFNGTIWTDVGGSGGGWTSDTGGNLWSGNVSGTRQISTTNTSSYNGIANNTMIGEDAGANLGGTTGNYARYSVGLGYQALMGPANQMSNFGVGNVGIGYIALKSNTTGGSNTGTGYNVLSANVGGNGNSAYGQSAMSNNVGGGYNTASGMNALSGVVGHSGSYNVAVGAGSLQFNSTGSYNIALSNALKNNVSGNYNFGAGYLSLANNINGNHNIASGYYSLNHNQSGNSNIVIGSQSMVNNISGSHNVAHGDNTLVQNTSGDFNIATGIGALTNSTTGSGSIAMGPYSAYRMVALGTDLYSTDTLYNNDGAMTRNIAIGQKSMFGSSVIAANTGHSNIAIAYRSQYSLSSGNYNVSEGIYSLYMNSTGSNNTATGSYAGKVNLTGSNNTFLGANSDVSSGALDFATAIGANSKVSTSNTIALGRGGDVVVIGMTGADTTTAGFGMLQVSGNITPGVDNSYTLGSAARRWSAVYAANGTIQTSDARLKTNVITMEPAEALAMVNALRPVRYNWINPQDGTNRKVGFLAHELAAVLPEVVYLPLPADQNGFLGVNYSEIVPALVGAINAQQLIIGKLTPTPAGLKFSGEFEATVLRSKKAYLDEITAKTIQADLIKAKEIEAEKIVSGEMNVASGAGCVGLFSMKPGAVYEVRSLAAGGGWASMRIGMANTGPVIQTREASKDGLLDLNVLAGNTVCATVAAGQQARASWLRVL